MDLRPTPFKRYAGSGISCLRPLSVRTTLARELPGAFWVLADIALCGAALALGTPVGSAQVGVFIAMAAAWSGLRFRRRRTLPLLLLAACLLALVVRSGVIELLTQVKGWSAY